MQEVQAQKQLLVEGYRSMRSGILLLFIAWILMVAGLFALIGGILAAPAGGLGAIVGGGIGMLVLALIGLIVLLVGMYVKFIPGVGKAAKAVPEYKTSSTLIRIGFIGGPILAILAFILLIAGGLAANPGLLLGGLGLLVIGGILGFIGYIGLIVLSFKLHGVEQNTLYLVAGILFIIGLFIGITSIISWILLYVALGDSIRKAEAGPAVTPSLT